MRKTQKLVFVVALVLLVLGAQGQGARPAWKQFTSRAGWSITYPPDWRIASCHSCKDATAPDVFVDFFPSQMKTVDGWVMVEPLANKPADTSADAWLAEISKGANQNPHVSEQNLTLNGCPALRVRYSHPNGDMEEVYVISGSKTFSISFDGDPNSPGTALDTFRNYPTYLKMVESFHVKQ